jgi:hypothetical protein
MLALTTATEALTMATPVLSRNALVARSGFRAENVLIEQGSALTALSTQYFHKPIVAAALIPGRTKSDVKLLFDDATFTTAQVKNGNGGGRGWSFDRRSADVLPISPEAKSLLKSVCLRSGMARTIVPMDTEILRKLFLGEDEATKPQHFIHTNMVNGIITELAVCPADEFITKVNADVFTTYNAKRTCVHVSPLVYLQRKGGGSKDHSPNDIQAKLRVMPNCMNKLTLAQTTPAQLGQTQEAH